MDPKSDEGIFFGYSTNNRAYIVFNSITNTKMESINVDDSTVEKAIDVEHDVGTSFQQPDSPKDVPDIESNIGVFYYNFIWNLNVAFIIILYEI